MRKKNFNHLSGTITYHKLGIDDDEKPKHRDRFGSN